MTGLQRSLFGLLQSSGRTEEVTKLILSSPPHTLSERLARAVLHYSLNNRQAAFAAFKEVESEINNPPSSDSWNFESLSVYSRLLVEQGDLEQALKLTNRAVELNKDYYFGRLVRAECLLKMNRPEEAVADVTECLRLAPDEAWWLLKRRAEGYFALQRYAEALADFSQLVGIRPADTSIVTWIDAGRIAACPSEAFRDGMLKLADEAVEVNHGAPDHRAVRGVLRASMGRMAEAQEDFDAVAASPTAKSHSLYQAALVNLSAHDQEAYRQVCGKQCERSRETQDLDALHWAVWTCVLTPNAVESYDGVTILARRALAQRQTDRRELLGLGAVLFRAGQFEEAKQHLTAASEAPNAAANCPAWYFLAMTSHRLGQSDEARKWLTQATDFTANILAESKSNPSILAWNRRLTLELLDAEAKALLLGDLKEKTP